MPGLCLNVSAAKLKKQVKLVKPEIVEHHCKQFICHNIELALQAKLVEYFLMLHFTMSCIAYRLSLWMLDICLCLTHLYELFPRNLMHYD